MSTGENREDGLGASENTTNNNEEPQIVIRSNDGTPLRIRINSTSTSINNSPGTQAFRQGPAHLQQMSGNNSARIKLPPLEPQLSPESSNQVPVPEDLMCIVCHGLLKDPVTCGSCAVPFGRNCLAGVIKNSQQQNQPAKCPCCRQNMTMETLQTDTKSKALLENTKVTCVNCKKTDLSIARLEYHLKHECLESNFTCAYKPMGCMWVGKRSQFEHHQATCPLVKIKVLIEQLRHDKALNNQNLQALQQNINALIPRTNVMVQATVARHVEPKSCHNPFDMLKFVYVSSCLPSNFAVSQAIVWKPLYQSVHARSRMHNFLVLLPILVQSLNVASIGLTKFLSLWDGSVGSADDILGVSIDVLLSLCVFLLCVMALCCFYMDGRGQRRSQESPYVTWRRFTIKGREVPSFQYLTEFALFSAQLSSLELLSDRGSSLLAWTCVVITCRLLPCFVQAHVDKLSNTNQGVDKAADVVKLALQAIVCHICGIWPFIMLLLGCIGCFLLKQKLGRSLYSSFLVERIQSSLPAAAFCIWIVKPGENAWFQQVSFAFLISWLSQKFWDTTATLGSKMGVRRFEHNRTNPRREHSALGIAVMGTWFLLLGAISMC